MSSQRSLLETENLKRYFNDSSSFLTRFLGRDDPPVRAVDDVSIKLHENTTMGLIGESGCGKTTLLHTLMGLDKPTSGKIYYEGENLSTYSKAEWKEFRRNVQVVFQDPYNSLDPKLTVEEALAEPLKIHGIGNRDERIDEMLETVELNPPQSYRKKFPERLSGGERQRVSIARALILEPKVILADEPVAMLDVSIQASILDLLSRLTDQFDTSMVYVSHDLSTVSYVCDIINVMYLGRIVETAPTRKLLEDPKHPYSQALIQAIPLPDPDSERERTQLEGSVDSEIALTEGCRFRDRCPERMPLCDVTPEFIEAEEDHYTACHLYYDHEEYVSRSDVADEQLRDGHKPDTDTGGEMG